MVIRPIREWCPRCGETGGAGDFHTMCWDRSATGDDIDAWIAAYDPQKQGRGYLQLLQEVGDPRAAEALRRHINTSQDDRLLATLVYALGWCGDESDEELLTPLLDHDDPAVRGAARGTVCELSTPHAADLLWGRCSDGASGRDQLLECLAWLKDPRVVPLLEHRLAPETLGLFLGERSLATALVQAVGLAGAERFAEVLLSTTEPPFPRGDGSAFIYLEHAAGARYPELVADLAQRLRDLPPSQTSHLYGSWRQLPADSAAVAVDRTVPKVAFRRSAEGPAQFRGQPAWRDEPAWPIDELGQPMWFYGQFPIDHSRTAYLFFGESMDWSALGDGSAVVIQPGNTCHRPTESRTTGPQTYEWYPEDRYRRRSRRLPAETLRFEMVPGADPLIWSEEQSWPLAFEDANKVGGTPTWAQGDSPPENSGWRYAFQFGAEAMGREMADGAMIYGWEHDDGRIVVEWTSA